MIMAGKAVSRNEKTRARKVKGLLSFKSGPIQAVAQNNAAQHKASQHNLTEHSQVQTTKNSSVLELSDCKRVDPQVLQIPRIDSRLELARQTQQELNQGLLELALLIENLSHQTQDDELGRNLRQCARTAQQLAREGRQSSRKLRDPIGKSLRQRLQLSITTWVLDERFVLHMMLAENLPAMPRSLTNELLLLVENILTQVRNGGARVLKFAARQWQEGIELLIEDDGQPMKQETVFNLQDQAQFATATLENENLITGGNRIKVRLALPNTTKHF